MIKIIDEFIDLMMEKYNLISVMVTGSFITGTMMENSDIDLFFISEDIDFRGRTFYKDIEFEYFASTEESYYKRLENDLVSQQIYSKGKILRDKDNILKNIQLKAIEIVNNYNPVLTENYKIDLSFYIETMKKDGEDLLLKNNISQFKYFSGIHIPKFTNILCKINKKYPLYEKYSLDNLKDIDMEFYKLLISFYNSNDNDLLKIWNSISDYLLDKLGNIDIKEYKSSW